MKHLFPGISINILRFRKLFNADGRRAFAVATLFAGMCQSAAAATLCVNPSGKSGCYSMIGAAVMKARADYILDGTIDTINVAAGTYMEDVIIRTPLSLVGAGRGQSIINAVSLSNGIYIDGLDNPGLSKVVVTGFTIENANFEGILVTNASFVTIWNNEVINNDRSLNISTLKCPGQPAFETNEDFDCGEGIHLIGVDHSTVVDNTSEKNSGGILLSDETGATHHNLIIGNLFRNNPFDCGITLASHSPAPSSGLTSPPGVYSNTIAKNESFHNGLQVPGAGAGVGLFAPGPGNKVYANVVINNQLKDNGLPGVAFHNHASFPPPAPPVNLNDNLIVGNRISGNGADTEDAATPGPTGINVFGLASITGTVIAGNVIEDEAVDIATKTPAQVNVHLNDLLGEKIGVDNLGTGTVDATENWWGSPGGPGVEGATSVSGPGVFFTPWLRHPIPMVSPPEDGEKGNQGDGGRNNAER
jgi:Right handed beta helix region